MNPLNEKSIVCPYCCEQLEVLIDPTDLNQEYIEDCQVCCQPITFVVTEANHGELDVQVYSADEVF